MTVWSDNIISQYGVTGENGITVALPVGGGADEASRLKDYASWYFWVYIRVHLLRREPSACGWGGWGLTGGEGYVRNLECRNHVAEVVRSKPGLFGPICVPYPKGLNC